MSFDCFCGFPLECNASECNYISNTECAKIFIEGMTGFSPLLNYVTCVGSTSPVSYSVASLPTLTAKSTVCVHAKPLQSCPVLCDPMDSPGSSVHGIFQARVLEWGAIAFSRSNEEGPGKNGAAAFHQQGKKADKWQCVWVIKMSAASPPSFKSHTRISWRLNQRHRGKRVLGNRVYPSQVGILQKQQSP